MTAHAHEEPNKAGVLLLDLKSYYPSPPFQLGLLAAYALTDPSVEKSLSFTFAEYPRDVDVDVVAQEVLAADVQLIAASNYSWNSGRIEELLTILSRSQGKLPWVLLGGPNCTGTYGRKLLSDFPILSAVVQGEGEPAFLDICRSLSRDPSLNPFRDSRNCILNSQGETGTPGLGHRIHDLDDIPSPYRTGLLPVTPSPVFYETNRGCPYRCSFCYWGNGNSKVYRHSLERISEDLAYFAANKVRALWLADANFGLFPDDADIAKYIVEINRQHGSPLRSVGVNWAKNSSERVLDIASIFRENGIDCSTTIALQSITPDAEELSKRYSIPVHKFVSLVRAAEARDVDTYTDLILGLPGEDLAQFKEGIETVSYTGVPVIKIHQLVLIPGTEFFDKRSEYGFLTADSDPVEPQTGQEKSEFYETTVTGHPLLSRKEMVVAKKWMGLSHLFHNHALGRASNLFLAAHGMRLGDIYSAFLNVLNNPPPQLSQHSLELGKLHSVLEYYSLNMGADENQYYSELSRWAWYGGQNKGAELRIETLTQLFTDFYAFLIAQHQLQLGGPAQKLLNDLTRLSLLLSPKPGWKPLERYDLATDAMSVFQDLNTALARASQSLGKKSHWAELTPLVQESLSVSLSSEPYVDTKMRASTYTIENPWPFPPSKLNLDWLVTLKSKLPKIQECRVSAP